MGIHATCIRVDGASEAAEGSLNSKLLLYYLIDPLTRKGLQQTEDTRVMTTSCTIISTSSECADELDDPHLLEVVGFAPWLLILACSNVSPLTTLHSTETVRAARPRLEKANARPASALERAPCTGRKHQVPGN